MSAEVKSEDPFGLLEGTQPVEDDERDEDRAEESAEEEAEPEAKAEGDADPEADEAEESKAETADEPEAEGSSEGEPEGDPEPDPKDELAKERAHREGLQKALMEQRQRNQQLRAQMAQMQAPNPATYAAQNAGQVPGQVPGMPADPSQSEAPPGYTVSVSPDGQTVYVPRDAIANDARAEAQAIVQQQMEAFRSEQEQAVEQSFLVRDPQRHAPIVQEARMADEFVGLAMENAQLSGGLYLDPANPDRMGALLDGLRASGIVDQVQQQFPNVGKHFDQFFRAWASRSPIAKGEVYSMISQSASAPADPDPHPRREGRVVERVMDAPPSMARKGGASKDAGSDDQREFDKLYRKLIQSPEKMTKAENSRLNELGVKLGKDGFDED